LDWAAAATPVTISSEVPMIAEIVRFLDTISPATYPAVDYRRKERVGD
jgi:hypothetical protein